MPWSRRFSAALTLSFALLAVGAGVAQHPTGDQPRIGLVLSGGGARGCAHIGVLKVLEELRVPVHCIAGTSMGSIVGGLYAHGLSPARLEQEMTRSGNRRPWSLLLQDQPERTQRTFRRKEEEFQFLVDVGLGFHDGAFRVPKGLVQGQNLELELLALTAGAHRLASFDSLPIPFRAVAVALRTGETVVLDRGNLAFAMRASMSLPGIFAPAVVDGQELLDGGLVDNVPVDLARGMGATRLIVVDIGTPVAIEHADSPLAVSSQMVQILGQQNVDRSLATLTAQDVFVQPDLGDITSADFERAAESIAIGEAAARAAAVRLRELAVDEATYARFLARQRRTAVPITVRDVRVDNGTLLGDELILARVRVVPGSVLDIAALRADLERVHGLGNFESVTFELLPVADGQHDLLLHVTSKSWGPTYLKFQLSLTSNLEGRSDFGIGAQVNLRELNGLGAEWRSDVRVGDRTALNSEFYQPLVPSGVLFAAARVSAERSEAVASAGAVLEARVYEAAFDVGANLWQWGELRVGVARLTGDVDVRTLALGDFGFDFDDGVLQARLVADTLDNAAFPTAGLRFAGTWIDGLTGLGAEQAYQQLTTNGAAYASLGSTTFGVGMVFDTALADQLPIIRASSLGGFTRLSGLENGSVGGSHAALGGLLVRHRLGGKLDEAFGFPLFVGATFEAGNAWGQRGDLLTDLRLGGSVFTAIGTPLGPTYVAFGLSEGGAHSFYLFVGQPF